jgi:hypothetical protein
MNFRYLIERRFGPVKKRSFKNFIHPKRRLVVLTESILNWQKTNSKDSSSSTSSLANALNNAASVDRQHFSFGNSITSSSGGGGDQQKNQIPLAEVTSVSAIVDAKNSFRVATVNTEVHFQAGNEADMNEWYAKIEWDWGYLLYLIWRKSIENGKEKNYGGSMVCYCS